VNYILSNTATSERMGQTEVGGDIAALEWFRDWLAGHADHDSHLLAREDGALVAHFVRTVAGQWYAIGQSGTARVAAARKLPSRRTSSQYYQISCAVIEQLSSSRTIAACGLVSSHRRRTIALHACAITKLCGKT
jgi:hypothetical protein